MKRFIAAAFLFASAAANAAAEPRHGLSIFGDLDKPADFTHFAYVNPQAPKGGRLVFLAPSWGYNQNPQTFNTLNGYVDKGDAPPRIGLTFDSLMVRALDEPDAVYGSVAESVEISDDEKTYSFRLRSEPQPRFHDGTPITASDVAWSIETLKTKGHADLRLTLSGVEAVEASDDRTVVVTFTETASRELPLTVAGLPIFAESHFEGTDFSASTLEPILGSGPYRVGRFEAGRYIEYERVPDYWGADLPVHVGHYNFDVIRLEFFRDRTAGFESFKKGDVTLREEFTSKTWVTEYDFPAMRDGRVVKRTFPDEDLPSLQAWFINTRLDKFKDPRVREAIGLAFDFEWVNENVFYGAYARRTGSFFEGSRYEAMGRPDGEELAILEPFRDRLPPEVFEEVPLPDKSDGSGRDRRKLRRASELLQAAGYRRAGRFVERNGKRLTVEFLIRSPTFERVLGKYVEALRLIGIEASIRLVDPAQFQARVSDFDFDVVGMAYSILAPFESAKNFFSSEAAEMPGSPNHAGISDPVIDELAKKVEAAQTREELTVRLRALDRVVRAGHYTIPNWSSPVHRMAFWDLYEYPDEKPAYGFPYEVLWWAKDSN